LEKFKRPVKEEMWARALREWKRIKSINREVGLMVKSREVTIINSILFEEDEDVAEEIREQDNENQ
jgi:hypothetical protein